VPGPVLVVVEFGYRVSGRPIQTHDVPQVHRDMKSNLIIATENPMQRESRIAEVFQSRWAAIT
jgi:hypothetical protein